MTVDNVPVLFQVWTLGDMMVQVPKHKRYYLISDQQQIFENRIDIDKINWFLLITMRFNIAQSVIEYNTFGVGG